MIQDTFFRCFERDFPFEMTPMQQTAAQELSRFVLTPDNSGLFILRGYAGTGKTSLVASLVRVMLRLQRRVTLMAPTGRAAKVFTQHASAPAYTIHKVIYRQKRMDDQNAGFSLNINKARHTLFIADEASMIANESSGSTFFGSGRLLDDLLRFVYSGEGCRLLLVGDTAQLPPVGEEESPALSASVLRDYGFHVVDYELTEVMRQAEQSGILQGATRLRRTLTEGNANRKPTVKFSGFNDIKRTPGSELIEALEDSYNSLGTEQTIVITRSNKRAVAYNNGIRSTIFGREEGLVQGDVVMVSKNNYYWIEQLRARRGEDDESALPMDFIANGDIAVVDNINCYHEFYGLHFADVTLTFPDYGNTGLNVRVVLDALQSESPSLSPEQSDKLYQGVMEDYAEYPTKKKRMEKLRQDPNYNAVQIKYAYAVTCHKAQGGQWEHVFVDQGWIPDDGVDTNYYRWLYTAFTRATRRLDLVNWPEKQCE